MAPNASMFCCVAGVVDDVVPPRTRRDAARDARFSVGRKGTVDATNTDLDLVSIDNVWPVSWVASL